MKVLLVSADPKSREAMAIAVASAERALREAMLFLEARDGIDGIRKAWRELPELVVAEETSSRAGGFALARDLRGRHQEFPGAIMLLLDREQDSWLARWSGADAWFTKPVDPFALADTAVDLVRSRRETSVKETA